MDKWRTILNKDTIENYSVSVKNMETSLGSFLEFDPARIDCKDPEGSLGQIPFGVKDNISVKGFKMTCGSKILEDFKPVYDATVVDRLKKAGAVPVGKTNLDEFGMGSSTENSALQETSNPWDLNRVPGGSSGGSAVAVAAGLVPFALGTDTGGSVRQPAAFCGTYGLKPTYGVLSRYGLAAYASSLETPGIIALKSSLVRDVFHICRGKDSHDQTSVEWTPSGKNEVKVIGMLSPEGLDEASKEGYNEAVQILQKLGISIKTIEIPELKYVVPAYYTIATAEASANLARYAGIRYGHRSSQSETPEELIRNSREEGFGSEVKLRIMLGTYVLRSGFQDQYYIKAQKIRTAIKNSIASVFNDIDLIMMPVFPVQAFTKGSTVLTPYQQKMADKFTATANLAGLPALTIPSGLKNGLPFGFQLMAPAFEEERLFSVAEAFEKEMPLSVCPNLITME